MILMMTQIYQPNCAAGVHSNWDRYFALERNAYKPEPHISFGFLKLVATQQLLFTSRIQCA
jgi:hypothetical protein